MGLHIDKLRSIRKRKKITLSELAVKMGITRPTLSYWENAKIFPSEIKIRMLAKVLDVPVNEISDLNPIKSLSESSLAPFESTIESLLERRNEKDLIEVQATCSNIMNMFKAITDAKLVVEAIFSSLPIPFYIKDSTNTYITVNRSFLYALSLNKNYIVKGKKDSDFFTKNEAKENSEADMDVINTSKSILNKEDYIPGTRKSRWGLVSKIPLFDSEGKTEGLIAYFIDITKVKETESDLLKERKRLSNAIRGSNIGTWDWNVQTGKTIFNERWAEIIGYRLEEISPVSIETWEKYTHPDDLKASMRKLDLHFKKQLDYYECECRMKHKNGQWVWVLDRGTVSEWTSDGKPLIMYGTHQDITERKASEIKLAQSESNFRTFIEILDNIVLIANQEGRIIYSNPVASLALGYSSDELKGMQVLDLHPSHFHKEAQSILSDMINGNQKLCSIPLLHKDKRIIPVETRVSLGRWNGSDCMFGISKIII